jgi:hypothetical protein
MRWLSILMVWAACGGDSPSGDSDGGVVEVPMIDRERSLVWIDSAIVDDPSLVGLSRVMSAVGADAHGGTHLRDWFVAFSTTAHS